MARVIIICVIVASLAVGLFASAAAGEAGGEKRKMQQVYVFGDSYADTGNHDPESEEVSIYKPWRAPYGYTWPRTPTGRYSDGHVFTDFFASYMGAKWPVPFRRLNISTSSNEEEKEDYDVHSQARAMARSKGINFAFGGSGVFTTLNSFVPNVSTQIEQLCTTIDLGIVTINDLSNSLALFIINGNDYIAYYELHQTFEGIENFIPQVIEQMVSDLENLLKLGFTKLVITNLGPVGCLPFLTYLINYTACLDNFNALSSLHNSLLASRISNLQEKLPDVTFLTLDLNNAMMKVIQGGVLSIKPCCEGISGGSCGEVDQSDNPLYIVCSDVAASFYWDTIHPTNNGWTKIMEILLSSLQDTYHLSLAYAKI